MHQPRHCRCHQDAAKRESTTVDGFGSRHQNFFWNLIVKSEGVSAQSEECWAKSFIQSISTNHKVSTCNTYQLCKVALLTREVLSLGRGQSSHCRQRLSCGFAAQACLLAAASTLWCQQTALHAPWPASHHQVAISFCRLEATCVSLNPGPAFTYTCKHTHT